MESRILPTLSVLMLLTLSLTGCIGDAEPETEEGDPISLGESTDDWPTYYVASSTNLPTCPGANDENLGKLYYVEDVTEFQACTSSGWTTIDISSSGSTTISLNHPPRITAQVTAVDDDSHNFTAEWKFVGLAHWAAIDPEGEIVTVGIDADGDGTIDLNLDSSIGSSLVELPWNGSLQVSQITIEGERFLHLFRVFDVVAEDASGMTSTISVISSAIQNELLRDIYDADDIAAFTETVPPMLNIPQADIDWLTAPTTVCGTGDMNAFNAQDASAMLSGDTDDTMIRISWTYADDDLNWDCIVFTISNGSSTYTCLGTYAGPQVDGADCLIQQTSNSDSHWESDEIVYIKENGSDICTSTCDIEISVQYNGNTIQGTSVVTVE